MGLAVQVQAITVFETPEGFTGQSRVAGLGGCCRVDLGLGVVHDDGGGVVMW